MEIIEVPVNKIHPDPSQPRKSFREETIDEMAQSIKTSGVINPIEIDSKYIIITGETRWRAAKKAGLKSVPVKIMDIKKDARFMRQVIENVQHNTMNDWDTAVALKKLLSLEHQRLPGTPHEGWNQNEGITKLGKKIGKSRSYMWEKLSILEASKEFQNQVREGKLVASHVRVLSNTPPEHKKAIENKILSGEFKTREGGLEVARALTRNPSAAKDILAIDYGKYNSSQKISEVVSKYAPRVTDQITAAIKPTDALEKITTGLLHWLDTNTPDSIGKHNLHRVVVNLTTTEKEIVKWLNR